MLLVFDPGVLAGIGAGESTRDRGGVERPEFADKEKDVGVPGLLEIPNEVFSALLSCCSSPMGGRVGVCTTKPL